MLQIPGEVEVCRTDLKGKINSPADWSGKHLGITDTGSSTDFLTQYLATKNGVAPSSTHRIGVGAGSTFIAAMKQKAIDCGMTTEPTVSQVLSDNTGFILLDMRTADGSRQALGGTYPATSLYMTTSYVDSHKDVVQKLVNAYVATLKWIQTHTGMQIADEMPADYYAGVGKDTYAKALDSEKGIFNPTGIMPADGPKTCLAVQNAFNDTVKGKTIDLSKTYTDDFVKAAVPVA
jgi:NitT/TauT family transport system substrate-binding protein